MDGYMREYSEVRRWNLNGRGGIPGDHFIAGYVPFPYNSDTLVVIYGL